MPEIVYRKLSALKLLENNPRQIKEDDFNKLCESIQNNPEYFEARPLILSDRTGGLVVIAGNQRYKASERLGLESVPTFLLSGLTEAKEKEIIIRDNVSNGEWDYDILANEWDAEDLSNWGVEVPGVKFEPEAEDDNYEIPNEVKTDIVYGDLFEIEFDGLKHRLLCGDSTKSEDIKKLMEGELADCIFTDPPYDLEDNYSVNIFDSAKEDCHIFIMNSDRLLIENINNGFQWFKKIFSVDFRQARLVSNNQPMTRVDLIAEFNKGKGKFINLYDGFSTLIECSKIHNDNEEINFGHKQAKRPELPALFISHYSNKKELVCDFFGGSGSTLIASHQLDRNCYLNEFEAKNCQIIIDRFLKSYPDAIIKKI